MERSFLLFRLRPSLELFLGIRKQCLCPWERWIYDGEGGEGGGGVYEAAVFFFFFVYEEEAEAEEAEEAVREAAEGRMSV